MKDKRIENLRKKAMALPLRPGVYIMKDAKENVIYIGKAKALKNRVSQYFGSRPMQTGYDEKVQRMVDRVQSFDYIVTDSEYEALVLECSLIKQHNPHYNVMLKDSKGYHYIRISPPPYGRITMSRQIENDGAKYLGPYVSTFTVREAVDEVNRLFQLPLCNKTFKKGKKQRPCLNYHIKRCFAPCLGNIDVKTYNERLEQAEDFLTRGSEHMLNSLQNQMQDAAKDLEFEKAARLRDRITAISRLSEKQKVVMSRVKQQDVIALAQGEGYICYEIFRFNDGRLFDREDFIVSTVEILDVELSPEESLPDNSQSKSEEKHPAQPDESFAGGNLPVARASFILRYYSMRDHIPPQITVDGPVEDAALLERWLTELAGRRVRIVLPVRGEQASLVEMCRENAAERLATHIGMTGRETAALDELTRLLGMDNPPAVIESYDISSTSGSNAVGGMIVFENGKPFKSAYRRFMIKSIVGPDDYGAMQEVVTRRFNEYEKYKLEKEKNPKKIHKEDKGFGRLPDLILVDGGKGHVSAIRPVVESFGHDIPVYGMVKDSGHRTRAITSDGEEISINARRSAYTLVSTIQDEVHRWAITYHRQKRRQKGIGTVLTEINGIGPARAKALLRYFGSIKAISQASVEEISKVQGFSIAMATTVHDFFKENNQD